MFRLVLICAGAALILLPVAPSDAANWPDNRQWPKAKPESQGMSSELLREAPKNMGRKVHTAIVIRNGYDVWHYGDPYDDGRTWWSSASRSFLTTAFGMLIQEGKISMDALDAPARELPSATARRFGESTLFKHLLSYTSCANPPGSSWQYACNWRPMHGIFRDLAGMSAEDYINKNLAPAIGGDWRATTQNDGTLRVVGSASHLARWGYLWMHEGEWNGRQLVPAEFVRRSVQPMEKPDGGVAHPNEGWQIHLNKTGIWKGLPKDCYAARGAGGAMIMACPSLSLVIARNGDGDDDNVAFITNDIQHIVAAVTGPGPESQRAGGARLGDNTAPCHLLDASLSVPRGFGAAYNVFSASREVILAASCADVGAVVTAGTGANNTYIYEQGYEFRSGHWQPFSLVGENKNGVWISGSASANLSRSESAMNSNNFFIAYVCQWMNGRWYCGCRDKNCAENFWQLQAFRAGGVSAIQGSQGSAGRTAHIIFDTDIASDCDDAGALAMLHALANRGEVNLLAMVTSAGDRYSVGGVDVINTYYGRPNIPLGAYKGSHMEYCSDNWQCPYNGVLTREFESDIKHRGQVEDAVTVYRRTLSTAPDNSVTVLTVGFLTNLAALLETGPDQYSELTGLELVRRKVKQLVTMGGVYPSGTGWNLNHDGAVKYSRPVLEKWPTTIVFSGAEVGKTILTGKRLLQAETNSNPVRRAYDIWLKNVGRNLNASYDQTAVLFAVRGEEDLWEKIGPGWNRVNANGSNSFRLSPDGRHYYLKKKKSDAELARIIEDLMLEKPRES